MKDLGNELSLIEVGNLVIELCRNHPELCPHIWRFTDSEFNEELDDWEMYYECKVCGATRKESP